MEIAPCSTLLAPCHQFIRLNFVRLRGKKTYGTTHELGKTQGHNLNNPLNFKP
jgi:hypothetical protein